MPVYTLLPNGDGPIESLPHPNGVQVVGTVSMSAATFDNNLATYVALNPNSDYSWGAYGPAFIVAMSSTVLAAGEVVKSLVLRILAGSNAYGAGMAAGFATNQWWLTGHIQPDGYSTGYLPRPIERSGGNQLLSTPDWSTSPPQYVSPPNAPGYYSGGRWTQADLDNLNVGVTWEPGNTASPAPYGGGAAYIFEIAVDVTTALVPSVVVTAPTGSPTISNPTVAWTYTQGADGSGQAAYRVKVFSAAQYGAGGFDPETSTATWDSGVLNGSNASKQIGVYLANATFRAYVKVAQVTAGVTQWSSWQFSQFTTAVAGPGAPTVTAVADPVHGAIDVAVAQGANPAWEFIQVQRSLDGGATWIDLRDYTLHPVAAGPAPPANQTKLAQQGKLNLAGIAGTATIGAITKLAQVGAMNLVGIHGTVVSGPAGGAGATAQVGKINLSGVPGTVVVGPGAVSSWHPVPIGAGGFITGLDVVLNGAMVCRTDTYGAYSFDRAAQRWTQLVSAATVPVADRLPFSSFGVYEIAIAPSLTTTFYMAWKDKVYRSVNSGLTWVATALQRNFQTIANDGNRYRGRHIVIDPTNDQVVFIGIPGDGLYVTINGGTTWTKDVNIPVDTGAGYILAFDTASTVSGGRQQKLYCSVAGVGVFKTANAGTSWTNIGGPTAVAHMISLNEGSTGVDSTVLATQNDANVYRWNASAWATLFVGGTTWWSVSCNPNNKAQVVLGSDGAYLAQSADGGATWLDQGAPNKIIFDRTRLSPSIPWHAWTNENYMSNGRMEFDPLNSHGAGTLFFAEGIGVWWTNMLAADPQYKNVQWTSMSVGIEQMVVDEVRCLAAGGLVVECADRATFVIDKAMGTFPSTHGPSNIDAIIHGYSCSVSNDGYIYSLASSRTARSPDKGVTWAEITVPTGYVGSNGSICVDPQNHQNVVAAWANAAPSYTTNGGTSWSASTGVTIPSVGIWDKRVLVAADSVTSGTFYIHGPDGLYKSINSGATWTRVFAATAADTPTGDIFILALNGTIQNAPGTHDIWLSGGQQGGWPDDITAGSVRASFIKFTSNGTVANVVPNVLEVYKFGFGKPVGAGYPALYIVGWVSGVYGVWRSDNGDQATPSWTNIGTWPFDAFDNPTSVSGDPDTYGRVYIGMNGSGAVYRDLV